MAKLSLIFGVLMIALGVTGFMISSASSVTALIPAFVGVILVLLAAIAKKSPSANMHAMHVAALLALLGAGGSAFKGIPSIVHYLKGDASYGLRALSQGGFAILCVVFLVLCVRSFIAARRNRLANQ